MANLALGIKNSIIFLLLILIAYYALQKLDSTESFTIDTSAILEKVYSGSKAMPFDKPLEASCKKPELYVPLTATCDANIEFMSNKSNMKIKEDCQIEQDKNIMIINKYEDEKKMNNINQDVGADAYDEYDTYFELYKN